ncbi:MAG: hypothetical protein MRJ67_15220 [Nitrospirales bacterium]|nr:hypothetical protein [Nitrospira sp.]MDR4461845.1 hypothetical protein [Nitrospirales bacterium]MDR4485212.1 hypothetical protein [Nitrospirales bacterium]
MKKIKKKKPGSQALPAFLVGWTHGEPPPPGYIAAWFDEAYGGPLRIRFLTSTGYHYFEAAHTQWTVEVNIEPSTAILEQWQGRLQWEQTQLALLFSPTNPAIDRRDAQLHVARMARGVTLLTDGTTYDVATGVYLNPSDWRDRDLEVFRISDHIQVEHRDDVARARMWFHTRGLTKFGLDEIETFQPMGLSGREVKDTVLKVAGHLIQQGKNPKVGEQIVLDGGDTQWTFVRHRTDSAYGVPLAFREFILE